MNPCIGDRQLEPDDEPYCCECDTTFHSIDDFESHLEHCDPVLHDPGEPNDYPE